MTLFEWKLKVFYSMSDMNMSSIFMLFYYMTPWKITPLWPHDACSSLLGMRERFTCWTRVSYLWLKKKGVERGKAASALGWNMDMQTLSHFTNERCCIFSLSSLFFCTFLSRKFLFCQKLYMKRPRLAIVLILNGRDHSDHLKTELLTIQNLNFKMFWFRMAFNLQSLVFKPPLY